MKKVIYEGKNTENTLYILRGLPGSGKSTMALKIGGLVFSTDDFFIKDGKYKCDPSLYPEAHGWNIKRTKEALENKNSKVIVDNTNTCAWEIRPYVEYGIKNNYTIVLVEPDSPYSWDSKKLAEVNTHRIPEHKIQEMCNKYEKNLTLGIILAAERPLNKKYEQPR